MNNFHLLLEVLVLTYPFREELGDSENIYERVYQYLKRDITIPNYDQFKLIVDQFLSYDDNKLALLLLDDISLSSVINIDQTLYLRETNLTPEETFDERKDLFFAYNNNEKILIWYYLSRFIYPDIISINYLVLKQLDIKSYLNQDLAFIPVADKLMTKLFQKGLSENHVHLNGAVSFGNQFWYLIGKKGIQTKRMEFIENNTLFNRLKVDDIDWQTNILACILVRYYLAEYVMSNLKSCFNEFLNEKKLYILIDFIEGRFGYKHDSELRLANIQKMNDLINELEKDHYDENDFISRFLTGDQSKIYGEKNEYYFLYNCLQFLHKNKFDKRFYQTFMNYIIFKNNLLNNKVESDLTKGLAYFTYYFEAQKGIISLADRYNIAFDSYYNMKYVHYLELRKSIDYDLKTFGNIYRWLVNDVSLFIETYLAWISNLKIEHNIDSRDTLQVGIVYHFQKKHTSYKEVCLGDYLTNKSNKYLYYGELQKKYELQFLAIQKLRNDIPLLRDYIVGIDVAGNEHNVDPYVFTPLYYLNRKKLRLNKLESKDAYNYIDQDIGLTFHVGEVFHSIISGLRHIDEVITYCQYKSGDRLGHATAVMLDLKEYLQDTRVIKITVIEYLENLLYFYILKSQHGILLNLDYLELKTKIKKCTEVIFGSRDITIDTLIKVYRSKFCFIDEYVSSFDTCLLKCPKLKPNNHSVLEDDWNYNKLKNAFHCNHYLKKMNSIISVKEGLECYDIYKQVQDYLLKKICSKGISIEVNPVSNSRISEIKNEFDNPVIRIFSKNIEEQHDKRAIVSLCTDDPAVFNTNLIYQYVLLEQQLLGKGLPKLDVLNWLEEIRRFGMTSTFIDKHLKYSELKEELNNIMKKLHSLK